MTKAADGEVPYTDEKLVAAADKIAEWAEKGYFGESDSSTFRLQMSPSAPLLLTL